jgi:outer membrane protein assembly factor BamB
MSKKTSLQRAAVKHPLPYLLAGTGEQRTLKKVKIQAASNPAPRSTLGDFGLAVQVLASSEFPEAVLVLPYDQGRLSGIDPASIRIFRWNERERTLQPIWRSGVNVAFNFVWTKIHRAGKYVAIGLPRDRLLREALRTMARERRLAGDVSPAKTQQFMKDALRLFMEAPEETVEELREFVARLEVQTGLPGVSLDQAQHREGGHIAAYPLPGEVTLKELRQRLQKLDAPQSGLPEETLFYPPDLDGGNDPPWPLPPEREPWNGVEDWRSLRKLDIWRFLDLEWLFPWLFSKNWWMYQHDDRHTGHASGASSIQSTNVSTMIEQPSVAVDGLVITKPSIVNGKIYIGSGRYAGGPGGTLHKIDLATGTVEGRFPTSGSAFYSWYQGIGGSPAVVGDKVYFTGVHGVVYCVDVSTMTPTPPHPSAVWATDLSALDQAKNQPVNNPNADCWSGPLVVNGKVYIGCGEGESASTYGFIYCLDATDGHVLWLFCTSKFSGAADNNPNTIPSAVAAPWAAGAGFNVVPNPPETGSAVWSSCAYDYKSNRIFVGTGNSQYPHTAQPDEFYGSGLIALDADTGQFKGFFQPSPDDSYWPGDSDIDVPGSPTVFTLAGQRVVAFGSKNGSFFVLDANTLAPVARRQLLPKTGGSGLPGDRGTGIPSVVPTGGTGENRYGVMGTPAVHSGLGRLFVGIGGYNGMALDAGAGIDQTRTPFLRALDWGTLVDAWPTALGADGVARYTTTKPPMYMSLEVGLTSPAVVNDVVFVSTNKTGLYALDATTGVCLWSASGLPAGQFALGPAIYGNYVVMGAGSTIRIYKLRGFRLWPPWLDPWWRFKWPWPPPPPEPRPPIGPWPWPGPDPSPERGANR